MYQRSGRAGHGGRRAPTTASHRRRASSVAPACCGCLGFALRNKMAPLPWGAVTAAGMEELQLLLFAHTHTTRARPQRGTRKQQHSTQAHTRGVA
jgi:hypothetical protein